MTLPPPAGPPEPPDATASQPPPPGVPAPPDGAAADGSGRRRGGCLRIVVIALVLLVLLAVGGVLALRSGAVSPLAVQQRLMGVASVAVYNLSDGEVAVGVTPTTEQAGDAGGTETLASFDSVTFGTLPPGEYVIAFETTSAPPSAECRIEVGRGEDVNFTVLPRGIAVVTDRTDAATAADVDVARSQRCR